MEIGDKFQVIKKVFVLDRDYEGEYLLQEGDVIEYVELRANSYGVKFVDNIEGRIPGLVLRVPKKILEDKSWFKPMYRDKNLKELLGE